MKVVLTVRAHVLSRLQGMETCRRRMWAPTHSRAHVLSRLQGMETISTLSPSGTLMGSAHVLSRLQGMETWDHGTNLCLVPTVHMCFPVCREWKPVPRRTSH